MREQMKALDDFEMGDQWELVHRRIPGSEGPEPPHQRRGVRPAAIFLASIVVIGLVLFGLRALGGPKPQSAVGPGDIVRYSLDGPPQPISVGEGAAWVKIGSGSGTTNGIVRIDAQTGDQQVLDTPGGDWTAVGGGSAWLLCNSSDCIASASKELDPKIGNLTNVAGAVVRLDPTTGKVLGYTPLPGRGSQILGTPEGVWVSTEVGVSFVDASGSLTKNFSLLGCCNLIGADEGSLWVSGAGHITSLDPTDGRVLDNIPVRDACTMEVANGVVWVASCQGQGDHLMGIDSTTGHVLFDRPIQGYGQMRYANGVLWLAQRDPNDESSIQLVAFGPRTGDPMGSPITIPPSDQEDRFPFRAIVPPHVFFAVGEGSFWLTDFSAGEVIRMGIPNAPASSTPHNSVGPTGSISPTPTGSGLANYVNPMGIPITFSYPGDWYARSVSASGDGLSYGAAISNIEGAVPSQDPSSPSPGPMPPNPSLPLDYVRVTIFTAFGRTGPVPPDSDLPLSMDNAKVWPGPENVRELDAQVAGVPLVIEVSAGPSASQADLAAADAIVASIRPTDASASPVTSLVSCASHTTNMIGVVLPQPFVGAVRYPTLADADAATSEDLAALPRPSDALANDAGIFDVWVDPTKDASQVCVDYTSGVEVHYDQVMASMLNPTRARQRYEQMASEDAASTGGQAQVVRLGSTPAYLIPDGAALLANGESQGGPGWVTFVAGTHQVSVAGHLSTEQLQQIASSTLDG